MIIPKTGWFWTALHYAVLVLTLGRNRTFLTRYATTIGPYIALPPDWLARLDEPWLRYLLVHERVHVQQFKRWGFGSAHVGMFTMGFAYLFLPLPVGLAWFRWMFEREAYAAGIRAQLADCATDADLVPELLAECRSQLIGHATEQLTGGAYLWTWPWPGAVERWFMENV
jgi:hypothetical protein